jgi:DNA-binding NarL/FixJ family response regulator
LRCAAFPYHPEQITARRGLAAEVADEFSRAGGAATGQPTAARTLLDAVRACCVSLGAAPALARADTLLPRLALPRPPRPRYPAGLTAREVNVLRLVAAGQSTHAIARTLLLSPRTVERHIANLYGKIGAHGRADATAFAFRHHLT